MAGDNTGDHTGDNVVSRRTMLLGAAGSAAAGAVGGVGGGLAVPAVGAPPERIDTSHPPLWQTAFRRGLVYGSAWATWQDGGRYSRLLNREAAILFTQDDLLWYALKPTPDSPLDFTRGDQLFDLAERRGQLVCAAHLVWDEGFGEGWPEDYLWELSERRARRLLFGTLRETVAHYRGRAAAWLVCTEVTDPEGRKGVRTNVPWYQTIGPEYIGEAFALAREEDDEATLIINEYGFETTNEFGDSPYARQKATLQVLDRLVANEETRPDALGIQAHLLAPDFAERFSPGRYHRFLNEVAARGLDIVLTELDVNDDGLPKNWARRDRGVADVYRRYLDVTLDHPAVRAVMNFGLSDKFASIDEDWPRDDGAHRRGAPFDRAMQPKRAYRALRASLIEADDREPLWTPPRAAPV